MKMKRIKIWDVFYVGEQKYIDYLHTLQNDVRKVNKLVNENKCLLHEPAQLEDFLDTTIYLMLEYNEIKIEE